MSVLTMINQIPLFSNPAEAITWGGQYGLIGYHTHVFQGQTGYMAGVDHNQTLTTVFPVPIPQAVQTAYTAPTIPLTPIPPPIPPPTPPTPTLPIPTSSIPVTTTTTTTTTGTSMSSSTSSGGGGGGY